MSEHADRPGGTIHDLGYAHYDGPRLGRWGVWRSLYADTARGAYGLGRTGRAKVLPFLLLTVATLPALVTVVVVSVAGLTTLPLGYTGYTSTVQVVVGVFVAATAPVAVSRDLRFGVVALYFSRPLDRVDYVRAKLAASATAVLVLLVVPLLVLLVGALLAELPLAEQLPDLARALAGAVLLSLVLAGIGLLLAAATPRRGLGVAAVIAVLTVLAGVQTAVQGVATVQDAPGVAAWSGLLSPTTLVDGVVAGVLGGESVSGSPPPGALGAAVFTLVTVGVVAGCYGLLVLRYRRVSVS